jgi:hypothetical protein
MATEGSGQPHRPPERACGTSRCAEGSDGPDFFRGLVVLGRAESAALATRDLWRAGLGQTLIANLLDIFLRETIVVAPRDVGGAAQGDLKTQPVLFQVLRISAIQSKCDNKSDQIGQKTQHDLAKLYGNCGWGITHVLRCWANAVTPHYPQVRVINRRNRITGQIRPLCADCFL